MKRQTILIDNQIKLSGQNAAIFLALKAGPKTNVQLSKKALKYTSRISNLRDRLGGLGYSIKCKRIRQSLYEYTMSKR
jgi:hypothetical protein